MTEVKRIIRAIADGSISSLMDLQKSFNGNNILVSDIAPAYRYMLDHNYNPGTGEKYIAFPDVREEDLEKTIKDLEQYTNTGSFESISDASLHNLLLCVEMVRHLKESNRIKDLDKYRY